MPRIIRTGQNWLDPQPPRTDWQRERVEPQTFEGDGSHALAGFMVCLIVGAIFWAAVICWWVS